MHSGLKEIHFKMDANRRTIRKFLAVWLQSRINSTESGGSLTAGRCFYKELVYFRRLFALFLIFNFAGETFRPASILTRTLLGNKLNNLWTHAFGFRTFDLLLKFKNSESIALWRPGCDSPNETLQFPTILLEAPGRWESGGKRIFPRRSSRWILVNKSWNFSVCNQISCN